MSVAEPSGEKLQKVLARAGMGSRREMERWISDGRVSVDGRKASLGDRVLPHQVIRVDGQVIRAEQRAPRCRVLLYHKPEGELCARTDPSGRKTVFHGLPRVRNGRWVMIGRLDMNTAGLLLFTTDGELANRLMHPRYNIEREYAVRVFGEVDDSTLKQLRKGVELEDGVASFDSIRDAGGEGRNHWYHVTLHEGRNREVRRMWEAVGAQVSRLIRVRYDELALPRDLRIGEWRELEAVDVGTLRKRVGLGAAAGNRPRRQRTGSRRH